MYDRRVIPFSPPDISDDEIALVLDVLKSGWITSGQKVKTFESMISEYTRAKCSNALSSATAAMEIALRLCEIGNGDEVITTAYTYAATANVIVHTGAKVVFADLPDSKNNSFNIDATQLEPLINKKTKAIIAVDVGGYPCDYEQINSLLDSKKNLFKVNNKNKYQCELLRPLFLLDAAHSIGATYKGIPVGTTADISAFSFHAVKNVTTAEGGALTYNDIGNIKAEDTYRDVAAWALHGQDKSAFEKTTGGWRYNINMAGYKCNLSDLHAAIGIAQMRRYPSMLSRRKRVVSIYNSVFSSNDRCIIPVLHTENAEASYHLYQLRISGYTESERDTLIDKMAEIGIMLNVHYLPVPAHKAYIDLGYNILDYPNAFKMYENSITLPLYSKLDDSDALFIAESVLKYIER